MAKLELNLVLKLKSFHSYYINKFVAFFSKKFFLFFPLKKRQIYLPQTIEKYTVLRSPHVDKKARDQFERRTYQRVLYWTLPYSGKNKKAILFFLRIFRACTSLAVGIEFCVTYEIIKMKKKKFKCN